MAIQVNNSRSFYWPASRKSSNPAQNHRDTPVRPAELTSASPTLAVRVPSEAVKDGVSKGAESKELDYMPSAWSLDHSAQTEEYYAHYETSNFQPFFLSGTTTYAPLLSGSVAASPIQTVHDLGYMARSSQTDGISQ